jgi:quercetin dioxygenase-like cupin family protein
MVTNRRGSGRRKIGAVTAIALAVALLAGCGGGSDAPSAAASASGSVAGSAGQEVLLDMQELTVLDQPIAYPKKTPAQVSSSIIQLEPGQETGWNKHRVPMYAYVLEGTLSVEYDAGVTKEYPAGTALMEAQNVWHNGTNKGDVPVRLLVVFMGAKGAKNTVEKAP